MVKYKCPKCGTLYDDVPVKCVTCGAEFLPAEEQDKPKQVAQPAPAEAAPVEAAPVAAPVVEEAPAEKPVEAPKEEVKEAAPYSEASEMNFNSGKAKIPARLIVGFVLAFVTIGCYIFNDLLPYLTGIEPATRVYMGMGLAVATFILAIMTLAFTGKPERYEAGRKMAVAAKVLGIIFLIFSILNLLLWGGIGTLYLGNDAFKDMGYNWKATIDNYFMTGNFILVKYLK